MQFILTIAACRQEVRHLTGEIFGPNSSGEFRIGRQRDNDLEIAEDSQLSSKHCVVRFDGQKATLVDLDSSNGTFLNGNRITSAEIFHGDRIRAGQTILRASYVEDCDGGQPNVVAVAAPLRIDGGPPTWMTLTNDTSFQFAPMIGRVNYPGHSLTLIVKGTFDLVAGGVVSLAEQQPLHTGDEPYPDDEGTGSAHHESDLAYFKPKADLLLTGSFYTPDGVAKREGAASFRVGNHEKILNVFGDRSWQQGLVHAKPSEPAQFSKIKLRYENAFGGPGDLRNPVGRGASPLEDESGAVNHALPNIVDPAEPISSPKDQPPPAGFGPRGKWWSDRAQLLGTYEDKWFEERWPWFPEDFDYAHFNAAPPDMQVAGYLGGGEELAFGNLHPQIADYRSKLPGIRIRCFLEKQLGDGQTDFSEVKMQLDTLWVDMDSEQIQLLWRGVTEVSSSKLPEVRRIYLSSEDLNESPASLEDCKAKLYQTLAEEDAEFEIEEPDIPDFKKLNEDFEIEFAAAQEKGRQDFIAAGIDPDAPPPELSPEQKEEETRLIKELGLEEDPEPLPLTRERILEKYTRGESFAEQDLSGLDLSALDLHGVDFSRAILTGANLSDANLANANFCQAILTATKFEQANLAGANLSMADLMEANLNKAKLVGANLSDAICDTALFVEADMREVVAVTTSFAMSDLSMATLDEGNFAGADFSNAYLDLASAQQASFTKANLEGVSAFQINLHLANLTSAGVSEGCDLSQADLSKAVGTDSYWASANLTAADFSFSNFEAADFSSACINSSNFTASHLKFSKFSNAVASKAKFVNANLFEAAFDGTDLTEAVFQNANLYGADLHDSQREGVDLKDANIVMSSIASRKDT